jgi:excisionase family DNA binding protein
MVTNNCLLTAKEVRVWLRLSSSRLYALVKKKEIPHVKIGGKILFDKEKVQNWIETQSN